MSWAEWLVCLVLLAAVALSSGQAKAYPAVPQYQSGSDPTGAWTAEEISACSTNYFGAPCQTFASGWIEAGQAAPSPCSGSVGPGQCVTLQAVASWLSGSGQFGRYVHIAQFRASALLCPGGGSLSGSSCVCSSGQQDTGSSCETTNPCQSSAGQPANFLWDVVTVTATWDSGTSANLCQDGCTIRGSMAAQAESGLIRIWGPWTSTGEQCTEGSVPAAPVGTPPPEPCARGLCPGTVNGQRVCVACSAYSDPPSTVTNPDGSTTTTSTQCTGDSCTTTTTTTPPGGGEGSTSTSTQSWESFCAANSGSGLCLSSGGEGGGGEASPGVSRGSVPPVPGTLYVPRYPDGLAGVWTAKRAEFEASPGLAWVHGLVPSVGDGGCPQISFGQGSVLGLQVGGTFDVPCSVFTFIRAVMLLSALFLARALIFGG